MICFIVFFGLKWIQVGSYTVCIFSYLRDPCSDELRTGPKSQNGEQHSVLTTSGIIWLSANNFSFGTILKEVLLELLIFLIYPGI